MFRKIIRVALFLIATMLVVSCSKDDYLDAIPEGSTALIRMDLSKLAEQGKGKDAEAALASMLHVSSAQDCGLDASQPLYFFVSPDGNLGLSAAVDSKGKAEDWLNSLASKGICQAPVERHSMTFTILQNSWVVGLSSNTFLIMGPATPTDQPALLRQMVQLLQQGEDDGIVGSPLFSKLSTIDSPVALVAQANALPQMFIAPFVLGAPKDSDPSQVLIAAKIQKANSNCLSIEGVTYSENTRVESSLKQAYNQYRPIKGDYFPMMPDDALMGLFMNVDGTKFIKLMQQDKVLLQLLAGVNAAIDVNKIVSSVNGDMAVIVPQYSDNSLKMMWGAALSNTSFLKDVPYWKKSVPQGGRITDEGQNFYAYFDNQTSFYFGVSPTQRFYSGSSDDLAQALLKASVHPAPTAVTSLLRGKKVGAIVTVKSMSNKKGILTIAQNMLSPLFGKVDYIVYTMK